MWLHLSDYLSQPFLCFSGLCMMFQSCCIGKWISPSETLSCVVFAQYVSHITLQQWENKFTPQRHLSGKSPTVTFKKQSSMIGGSEQWDDVFSSSLCFTGSDAEAEPPRAFSLGSGWSVGGRGLLHVKVLSCWAFVTMGKDAYEKVIWPVNIQVLLVRFHDVPKFTLNADHLPLNVWKSIWPKVGSTEGLLVEFKGCSRGPGWVTQSVESPGDPLWSTAENPDSFTETTDREKESQ